MKVQKLKEFYHSKGGRVRATLAQYSWIQHAKHETDREQAVFSVLVFAFFSGCILETSIQ